MTQRRKRNLIEEIKDDGGRSFVRDLFTSSDPTCVEEVAALVANKVKDVHLRVLNEPFSREEVEEALFQMHPTKAPGLDGFPALFYQNFWGIVGDEVIDFCLQALQGTTQPGMINKTLRVLILKVKKAICANQFRPISLCNDIFKIITKTLANRMKLIFPD